jgi:hypothetical protein
MTIDQIIERLSEQYPDSEHQMTVVMFAEWLEKNAQPASEPKPVESLVGRSGGGMVWHECAACKTKGSYHPDVKWCICGRPFELEPLFTRPAPAGVVQLPDLYTCIGKGGEYEYMGMALGAGTLKEMSAVHIYKDTTTGKIFIRTPLDFAMRMAKLNGAPK